jgi:hypothetical protein
LKTKYARAYHPLCGLVLRGALFSQDKGEPVATRLFYIAQMEFAGHYVAAQEQSKAVPHFMLEFAEKLVDRAQKVRGPFPPLGSHSS